MTRRRVDFIVAITKFPARRGMEVKKEKRENVSEGARNRAITPIDHPPRHPSLALG